MNRLQRRRRRIEMLPECSHCLCILRRQYTNADLFSQCANMSRSMNSSTIARLEMLSCRVVFMSNIPGFVSVVHISRLAKYRFKMICVRGDKSTDKRQKIGGGKAWGLSWKRSPNNPSFRTHKWNQLRSLSEDFSKTTFPDHLGIQPYRLQHFQMNN